MPEQPLEASAITNVAGFRLKRFEVLNWGTFSHKVWDIEPNGNNCLVTGDIGSGKTTLVDGLQTLLVPPGKTRFNKSASSDAGGGSKERSHYTYIRGLYKNVRGEESTKKEAVYIRGEHVYSVLLATFYNEGYEETVSLAAVFSIRNHKVESFFVTATRPLTILGDFTDFGNDARNLKKRLNQSPDTETFDDFGPYSDRFRRYFGGLSREALLLFRDTISTKKIENLTNFVQSLMLEKPEKIDTTINDLYNNFDNLNHAHKAVLKAKNQIEMLQPVRAQGLAYAGMVDERGKLLDLKAALPSYIAHQSKVLLEKEIAALEQKLKQTQSRYSQVKLSLERAQTTAKTLQRNIDLNGGGAIEELSRQIKYLEEQKTRKQQEWDKYNSRLEKAGLAPVSSAEGFSAVQTEAQKRLDEVEQERAAGFDCLAETKGLQKEANEKLAELARNVAYLETRKSNIHGRPSEIRADICSALGVSEEALPFAGELIKVADQEKEWQGAIERVLHNFGLSLLVSESLYQKVSDYVNKTNLRGRITYFYVKKDKAPTITITKDTDPDSLYRKLEIRRESEFFSYLNGRLTQMFGDYICCRTMEEFRSRPMAVTLQGQIKSGGNKHEKDDRRDLNDSSTFILGWNNQDKIKAMRAEADRLFIVKSGHEKEITRLEGLLRSLEATRDALKQLEGVGSYSDIDWQSSAKEIAQLNDNLREIESSSNVLATMRHELVQVEIDIQQNSESMEKLAVEKGGLENGLKEAQEQHQAAVANINPDHEGLWPALDSFRTERQIRVPQNTKEVGGTERSIGAMLDQESEALGKKLNEKSQQIVQAMTKFASMYEAECKEVTATMNSLDEFCRMLEKLEAEDLPRHQVTFKTMLREQTINGISLLINELERNKDEIVSRIENINTSLREIEYNPGRYIELVPEARFDRDVDNFKGALKDCMYNATQEDDRYNEERFIKVKDLVEKLRAETAWTRKVTDVRNWFSFLAREAYRDTGEEHEIYDDSLGKSGGQQEKLAYTILASALAYQFGLNWGEKRSRAFRFIAIDEAFGRMSEESTRYGMELFKKLDLQFMLITPLQKLNIIEDYVQSIHYIHNHDGKESVVRNMTVEEYRAKKEEFLLESNTAQVVTVEETNAYA